MLDPKLTMCALGGGKTLQSAGELGGFTIERNEGDIPQIDKSCLKPGDVFLFADSNPKLKLGKIQWVQSKISNDQHLNKWSHVAFWDGELIYDAWPNLDIRKYPLSAVFREYPEIHVRRLVSHAVNHLRLQDFLHNKTKFIKYPSRPALVKLYWKSFGLQAKTTLSEGEIPQQQVCSTFVDQAIRYSTDRDIFKSIPFVLPIHFAISTDFECVKLVELSR
jgi:hypothetical protein